MVDTIVKEETKRRNEKIYIQSVHTAKIINKKTSEEKDIWHVVYTIATEINLIYI